MFDNSFMNTALQIAESGAAKGEVPIAAVIVSRKDKKIVATSYNMVESLNDPTAHAEIIAIREASKVLKSKHLKGCDIYVSLKPCTMCMHAIILARIDRLYYGADNIKPINHVCEIHEGIMLKEAQALLKKFFKNLR